MEEKPPQSQETKAPIHKIPVIRTYENDIAEATAQKKISSASISIAEADARRKEPTPVNRPATPAVATKTKELRKKTFGILKILISVILVCAGVAALYYLYEISPLNEKVSTSTEINQSMTILPSVVPPDTQKILDISGENTQGVISSIRQYATASNGIGMQELIFKDTEGATTTRVTATQFISKTGMIPPDAFTTSIDTTWMFGIDTTDQTGPAPFVIFTTGFFQNTFAGMLSWEPTIPENIGLMFGFPTNASGIYQNRILNNKNIREFISASGTPLFLYGFVDNNTLAITRNEATFSDIVNRIEKQTYVR